MKTKTKTHRIAQSRLFPLAVIAVFAVVGASIYAFSSAATVDNPVGFADFCRLESNQTTIYGWAHDNQAKAISFPSVQVVVGGQTTTVNTYIDGYRDSAINSYLSSNGYTPTSRYGYKASFSGIYKGSAPSISGTVLNYGTGTNQTMLVYGGSQTISEASNGGVYFVNGKVPDACLPTQPVVPGPDPTPTPTPTPGVPTPTPTPGTGSGTSTKQPTKSTPTNNNSSTSPPTETPTTTPSDAQVFSMNITLTNNSEPLADVTLKLNENEAESITDSEGVATFPDLTESSYTIHFDYENNTYESVLGISSEEMSQEIVEQTVEVSELTPLSQDDQQASDATVPKKSGHGWLVLFILLLLVAIVGATIFIRKRRSSTSNQDYYYPPTPVGPLPQSDEQTQPQDQGHDAGISLKDLVVDSMRKEAARHHKDDQS